jgi:hypothetical protein
MSFISHRCMLYNRKKTNSILRPDGKRLRYNLPSCVSRFNTGVTLRSVSFVTYKGLFKQSLRLAMTAWAHLEAAFTTALAWHMLCAKFLL